MLSEKANKFELKQTEKALEEKFCHITQYRQIIDKIDEIRLKVETVQLDL